MYDEILTCITEKNWNQAVKELAKILVHHPWNEEIAALSATVHLGMEHAEKAREAIQKGLEINDRNYELWLLLGQCYEASNQNQAYLCYENALYHCGDETDAQIIREYVERAQRSKYFGVRKSAIVIVAEHAPDQIQACVQSIRATCPADTYELIVVDNASADDGAAWLAQQPDIKLLRNHERAGFFCCCNQGIRMAEPDRDVLLLREDAILTDRALFWLRMGLYEREKVGAAGAVSNCISKEQQVAWNCSGKEEFFHAARRNNLPQKTPCQKKNWLSSFALLFRRDSLESVGYLDEQFTSGDYGDIDIGFRLAGEGYELLLCWNSFIYHNCLDGDGQSGGWPWVRQQDKKKLEEKWGFAFDDHLTTDWNLLKKIGYQRETSVKILHIGSGIGATLLAYKDSFPNAWVYGTEVNEQMVKVTPKEIEAVLCDFHREDAPFDKASFDIIMCAEAGESFSGQEGIAARAMEYLKVGGRLITHRQDRRKSDGERIGNLPLVSVVMMCYNHGAYVGKVIESILNQTYPNIELIVADNGSTDDSFEVIRRYKDRIKLLRLEKNNRQLCLKMLCNAATGEYIAQTTSDDVWMPEKIELQMDAFFSEPELKACFAWALYADENLQVYPDQAENAFLVKNCSRENWLKRFFYVGNCVCYASAVVKKDLFLNSVSAYRGFIQLGDMYQWVFCLLRGEIYVVEQPMVKFRWHMSGENRNDSTPSFETDIRTKQEQAEVVLLILESVDDGLFKRTFGDEFLNSSADSHAQMLCEKFLLLRRMAERTFIFSEIMLLFYHNHYSEMEHILKTEYGFLFEDSSELFARSGIVFAQEQWEIEKRKNRAQEEQIRSYIRIAKELSKDAYPSGFDKHMAYTIFCMLPEPERMRLNDFYHFSMSALNMIAGVGVIGEDIYFHIIPLIAKLQQLMGTSRDALQLLGMLDGDHAFELFEESVCAAENHWTDLQEFIIPYLQNVTEKLKEIMEGRDVT